MDDDPDEVCSLEYRSSTPRGSSSGGGEGGEKKFDRDEEECVGSKDVKRSTSLDRSTSRS